LADAPGLPFKVRLRGKSQVQEATGVQHWPAVWVDVKGAQQSMSALFLHRGARAWQVVCVGPKVDIEAAKIFTESFQLLGD
jgi:hypothetical protein